MVLHREHIAGYEDFCKFFEDFDSKGKNVHIYFSGSKTESGESWCSDCVRAWPTVEKQLEKLEQNEEQESYFIYVEVGNRTEWKDPQSPFRTDKRTQLMVVPTMVRWEKPQKLTGDQCEKEELVEMLLNDEDE